jgi:hypothetical protein
MDQEEEKWAQGIVDRFHLKKYMIVGSMAGLSEWEMGSRLKMEVMLLINETFIFDL